jgi:DNA-binding NarL/FixJ family response regulator
MGQRQLVVLFGESLFLESVETCLAQAPDLGVMRVHPTVSDVGRRLATLNPDLVILDWNAPNCEFALTFLQERPGVPVLCLDLKCSKVAVLTSRSYPAANAEELVQIVRAQAGNGHGPTTQPQAPAPAGAHTNLCFDEEHTHMRREVR